MTTLTASCAPVPAPTSCPSVLRPTLPANQPATCRRPPAPLPRRHPNVFPDGKVCISILHPPGVDAFNPQESAAERWSPVHTVRARAGMQPVGALLRRALVRAGVCCCWCALVLLCHCGPSSHPPTLLCRTPPFSSPQPALFTVSHPEQPRCPAPCFVCLAGGEHSAVGDQHAVLAQRRVTRQRGRSQGVAGQPPRVQEEGGSHRAAVTGNAVAPAP